LSVAELGFSLHAATIAGAEDTRGREALCKYVLRPPIASEHLQILLRRHRPCHRSGAADHGEPAGGGQEDDAALALADGWRPGACRGAGRAVALRDALRATLAAEEGDVELDEGGRRTSARPACRQPGHDPSQLYHFTDDFYGTQTMCRIDWPPGLKVLAGAEEINRVSCRCCLEAVSDYGEEQEELRAALKALHGRGPPGSGWPR
jgi:hypothetical protein